LIKKQQALLLMCRYVFLFDKEITKFALLCILELILVVLILN
jgi:hypothetical protein